jgi:hypothetical protein
MCLYHRLKSWPASDPRLTLLTICCRVMLKTIKTLNCYVFAISRLARSFLTMKLSGPAV